MPLSSSLFFADESKFKDHVASDGSFLHAPKLSVKSVKVMRGKGGDGQSCSDAGSLSILLSLPKASSFTFYEFGVYFKVVNDSSKNNVLAGSQYPMLPVKVSGNKAEYILVWVDERPEDQRKIDLELEIFSVTHRMEIGASSKAWVKSE